MPNCFEGLTLDQERALYGLRDAQVRRCLFDGPADGESALKECRDITVEDCDFRLRYPLWHVERATLSDCRMTDACRAALWYDADLTIRNCDMGGIKALRECDRIRLEGGSANSPEFGWMCRDLTVKDFRLTSEYPFLQVTDSTFEGLNMKAKYSFQYARNLVFRNCVLDTKDAFWHAENITVYDSVVKGEYLAWYSKGLRLINCKVIGTQPLCYCEDLVMENCEMEGADFAFENSSVVADLRGSVISVKNPVHGSIVADGIGEIILDEFRWSGADCTISVR